MKSRQHLPTTPMPEYLKTFPNRHPERDYFVSFTCREFTTCPCPLTGRPDFASLHIAYLPDTHIIKNASLAQYLATFKNHGDYHEDCINIILKDLVTWISPKYMEIRGQFTPRSSIVTHPYTNYGRPGTRYEALADERLYAHAALPL